MIWTTTPEQAKKLKDAPTDVFVDAVNDALVSVSKELGFVKSDQ